MNTFPFWIALRYWKSKKADRFGQLITRLATLGIALGLMALIIVLSVMNGLEHQQKAYRLANLPHLIIKPQQGFFSLKETVFSFEKDFPQIIKTLPINRTPVILQTTKGVQGVELIGIQSPKDTPQLVPLADEFQGSLLKGHYQILLSDRLAYNAHLQLGDKVRVMLTEHSQYTPLGQAPVQRLFTVSGIYPDNGIDETPQAFANLTDLGRLMRIPPSQVQGFRLFLTDPFEVETLTPQLQHNDNLKVSDWREQKGEFFQAVKMEKNMIGLLVSLIILVAISNIVTSLSLMVVDKQGEIAILRTLGLTQKNIRQVFIYQGLLVGCSGTFLGTLFGCVIALNLDKIFQFFPALYVRLPTLFNGEQVFILVLGSLFCTLLSTLYPAYRASLVQPAAALRDE